MEDLISGAGASDVHGQIIRLIARSKNLEPSAVTETTTFDQLQIDSLDKINLCFEIEEMFSIEIPDEDLNSLNTVGDIIGGVQQLISRKGTAARA